MDLSKVQRGKMEEPEKIEGQSCENNRRNSGEHMLRSTIKSPKPSQSTGIFPKVCFFVMKLEKVLKGERAGVVQC